MSDPTDADAGSAAVGTQDATVPFYERSLDSFADATITKASRSVDGRNWYASIDVGPQRWVSDPDFSRCAATQAEARRLCAQAIRDDARGIGKYAPHGLLRDGYDLHFRLMKHWAEKEAAGLRPTTDEDTAMIIPVVTPGPRVKPTPASLRREAETGYPAERVEAVYQDTWGHLRAEQGRAYSGHILFSHTCNGEITVLDWEFEDLNGGPWFPEHLMEFVERKIPANAEGFRLWRFDGTYRELKNGNGRFTGKVRPMRVQHRFAAAAKRKAA